MGICVCRQTSTFDFHPRGAYEDRRAEFTLEKSSVTSILAICSLLLVIVVSLLVVRVATVALVLTGLSTQLARFQARSAFTGAGFTTSESEKVTQHPLRRRIIMLLMLVGNAGFVTAASSLMLSFISYDRGDTGGLGMRLALLVGGVVGLWYLAHSRWIDRHMTRFIKWGLNRWTDLEVRDYSGLLHLAKGYSVVELEVEPQDWLANRELRELNLSNEGVLILGVETSDGNYLGAPRGQTQLTPGDTVIIYGPSQTLADLDKRRAGSSGNWDHHKAVAKQQQIEAEQTVLKQA